MSSRRALVTGATGGLGLALCEALRSAGYAVRASGRSSAPAARLAQMGASFVQGDLLTTDLGALCEGSDVVFHAAALSSPWGRREAFRLINVETTQRLLAAARKSGAGCFVFVSSPSIYAALKDQAGLTEDSPLPAKALNAYAATKRVAEERVLEADAADFRTVSVRPRALIGPDDAVLLPRILALVSRGWFPLFRGGRALVELTDVRDAARALVSADRNSGLAGGKAINVSGGKPVAVVDLARRLGEALGRPLRLRPVPITLATSLATALEGVCSTLPGRPEPRLTKYGIATLAYTQTFNLTRARSLLGYAPEHDAVTTAHDLAMRWAGAGQ